MKNEVMEDWLEYTNYHHKIEKKLENTLKSVVNLTLNEYYVLYYLGKNETNSMKLNDLNKYFNLSQSAMSRMMMRMENPSCGVIERRNCTDDKRGIYIYLTQKGKEKLLKASQSVEGVLKNNR